jgi:hypothetical protein
MNPTNNLAAQVNEAVEQSTFLATEAVAMLTGPRRKSKQIEALRMMGLPFWVNSIGQPIVTVAAIEGRREQVREKE